MPGYSYVIASGEIVVIGRGDVAELWCPDGCAMQSLESVEGIDAACCYRDESGDLVELDDAMRATFEALRPEMFG